MSAPLMTLHTDDSYFGVSSVPTPSPGRTEGGAETRSGVTAGAVSGGRGGGDGSVGLWEVEGAAWRHLRDPSRVVLRAGIPAAGPNEVLELCRQSKGSIYCVDTSMDGTLVASGGTDRMIRLLDPRGGSGRAAKVCKLDGHKDNVRCVRIDEGGTRVVSEQDVWGVSKLPSLDSAACSILLCLESYPQYLDSQVDGTLPFSLALFVRMLTRVLETASCVLLVTSKDENSTPLCHRVADAYSGPFGLRVRLMLSRGYSALVNLQSSMCCA